MIDPKIFYVYTDDESLNGDVDIVIDPSKKIKDPPASISDSTFYVYEN